MAIVQTDGSSPITRDSTKNNNGTAINVGGLSALNNLTSAKEQDNGVFASVTVETDDVTKAVSAGTFNNNNERGVAQKVTNTLAGTVSNDFLTHASDDTENSRKYHKQEIVRTTRNSTAIRSGNWNIFTGSWTSTPTDATDLFWDISTGTTSSTSTDDAVKNTYDYPGEITYKLGQKRPVSLVYSSVSVPTPTPTPTPTATPTPTPSYDADAAAFIASVESQDGSSLESSVASAINDFVVGCKADNLWDAIKSAGILIGAKTLSGALVPLKGTAVTPNNFMTEDYNRKTGLIGDNTAGKWLDSNRSAATDPQDNFHMSCYITEQSSNTLCVLMGAGPTTVETGATNFGIGNDINKIGFRNRHSTISNQNLLPIKLAGISRAGAGSYTARSNESSLTISIASETPVNENIGIFAATNGSAPCSARVAFYSIGENLNLTTLDSRVSALVTAINSAI